MLWFEDYDELMFFKDCYNRARAKRATGFDYEGYVYSMDCAEAIINEIGL